MNDQHNLQPRMMGLSMAILTALISCSVKPDVSCYMTMVGLRGPISHKSINFNRKNITSQGSD